MEKINKSEKEKRAKGNPDLENNLQGKYVCRILKKILYLKEI